MGGVKLNGSGAQRPTDPSLAAATLHGQNDDYTMQGYCSSLQATLLSDQTAGVSEITEDCGKWSALTACYNPRPSLAQEPQRWEMWMQLPST
eukprot:1155146-Pelagomonas_calceolata.AAC.3